MKKIIIGTIVLLSQISFGQITKTLGEFDQVKVFDKLNVKLIESSKNEIIIVGERENEVEVVNKNGQLKIRMPFPKLLSGDNIDIELHYKHLETIEAAEGSIISNNNETIKQRSIDLNAIEGSQINLNLDVESAKVRAVSGGIINLDGVATNQFISLGSGGVLQAKNLETKQTNIRVSAGGNAEINASNIVDVKVKAGGSVFIYGKPKQINQETILGGTIIEK